MIGQIGLVLATHNSPVFLRNTLLQIEAQTLLPTVVAIHENNQAESFLKYWPCAEVMDRLKARGVQFLTDLSPVGLSRPFFQYLPLKRLVDSKKCVWFTKMDQDDLFREWHLKALYNQASLPGVTWVGLKRADVLVLNATQYVHREAVDFGLFNPLGGPSDAFMYNYEVAEVYLKHMISRAGKNEADDWVLHAYTLPLFPTGRVVELEPTMCYVSHGRNDSTSHWVRQTPEELR